MWRDHKERSPRTLMSVKVQPTNIPVITKGQAVVDRRILIYLFNLI